MPNICKKITRLVERGFKPYVDKGRFRHVKGYQERLQNFSKRHANRYASEIALKLYSIFENYDYPKTRGEFEELYRKACHGLVSPRKIIRCLPDNARSKIVTLSGNAYEEPYFTQTLTGKSLEMALQFVNNVGLNQIPYVVSLLDQACKDGIPIENVIEKEMNSNEDIETTVRIMAVANSMAGHLVKE
jgi:hypothetical protein